MDDGSIFIGIIRRNIIPFQTGDWNMTKTNAETNREQTQTVDEMRNEVMKVYPPCGKYRSCNEDCDVFWGCSHKAKRDGYQLALNDIAQFCEKHTWVCKGVPQIPVISKQPLIEFIQSLRKEEQL